MPGVLTSARENEEAEPGNVIVEIHWPPEIDADVDLWVRAPGDMPDGYSNKGTALANLLRDDLGQFNDLTESNYEVTYSRGIVAGEWTVNLHAFRMDPGHPPPYTVRTVVSVMRPAFLSDSSSTKSKAPSQSVTCVRTQRM
ncbi:MAG: hypothetical protein QF666_17870 [Alphaproteobacteria bacterium]|nr:hypothetical protein [Alphaproteobacteria bacterium]MDP6591292.1 hypothetical protein [Alphaproteobacteria bacterium]